MACQDCIRHEQHLEVLNPDNPTSLAAFPLPTPPFLPFSLLNLLFRARLCPTLASRPRRLHHAVRHIRSDVPYGCFLSAVSSSLPLFPSRTQPSNSEAKNSTTQI